MYINCTANQSPFHERGSLFKISLLQCPQILCKTSYIYIIPGSQYCSGGDGKNEEREVSEKVRHQWAHVAEQAEVIDKVKAQSTASIVELREKLCNSVNCITSELYKEHLHMIEFH